MTTEEKARAYDEALEKAKIRYDNNPTDGYVGYANLILEELFPQLHESEGERIRKELIQYLKDYPTNLPNGQYTRADFFAYLEKQKEQKPVTRENDFVSKPQTSVEILRHYLVWAGNSESEEDCPYTWRALADAIRDGIKALEKQKPAEWSKKDKNRHYYLCNLLRETWDKIDKGSRIDDAITWLEELPERIIPHS